MPVPPFLDLVCHPDAPDPRVHSIRVAPARDADGALRLAFRLDGDLAGLAIPEEAATLPVERLWAHTCFELFVTAEGAAAYREFNFSPSGQWMCFDFAAYRQRTADPALSAPDLRWRRAANQLALDARLPAACLPPGALRLGFATVVEHDDGSHRYWALGHPPGRPDFHHRDGFALALPSPDPMIQFGLDRLLADPALRRPLAGKRVALLAHPASLTRDLTHAIDALAALPDIQLSAAFGPQHGLRGDKQDNMVESPDFFDPVHGIPVFSLYGEVRRPTATMMDRFDVLLVDLQDLGCRIYTFITTLRYVLEAAARHRKAVWILDRPNPAGRPVEGTLLQPGWESFVGAGPLPMRHGLSMGELARWFIATLKLDVECEVIAMEGWNPDAAPGYGWPVQERSWVNPSPNAPNLSMARIYAGTVMLEGTTLSEGRGTTRPLELFGAPDIDARQLIAHMQAIAPRWLVGCRLRECWFEPTFHKHAGRLCSGVQIHVEDPAHYDHAAFRPWRLQALAFKAIRHLQPDYPLWRDFPYEYERGRLAIDLINGSESLREWVDDAMARPGDLDALAFADEREWLETRREFLLY